MADEAPREDFRRSFRVGWGDVDANGHMANTAFLDHAADTRLAFFAEHGYPGSRLATDRLGPVIVRDELAYRREQRLLEEFTVDLCMAVLSADGVRFHIENTFRTSTDEVAAAITSEGLWFDLELRRPRAPPEELNLIQRSAPRARSFQEIASRGH
jgi:acyl-CoA thioester hydrolase